MTNAQIAALIDEGVAYLKKTTVGYSGKTPEWYANQTTNWAKGLDKLKTARTELTSMPAPLPDHPRT